MGKHVEWRRIPNQKFEVNRLGDLRKFDTKQVMDDSFIRNFYRGRSVNGDPNEAKRILLNLIFPEHKR
jgi:hypothetical protein